jgi:hypothetical protein
VGDLRGDSWKGAEVVSGEATQLFVMTSGTGMKRELTSKQYDAFMEKIFAAVPEDKVNGPFTVVVNLVDSAGRVRMVMSLERFEQFRKSKRLVEVKGEEPEVIQ